MAGEEMGFQVHQLHNLSYNLTANVNQNAGYAKHPMTRAAQWANFFYASVVHFATQIVKQVQTAAMKIKADLS